MVSSLGSGPRERRMRRGRTPALGLIIIIDGIMMMLVAVVGLAVSFSGAIKSTYMSLALETPKFHYSVDPVSGETGNEMFEAFVLMRYIAMGVFVIVLIFAGVAKVMDATETGIELIPIL